MKNKLHNQSTLFEMVQDATRDSGPVTCLGLSFPNDEERRKHFLGLLREKLKDPEFRKIEGFPHGSDEDILALSDPPYYTACPNPFVRDFITHWSNEKRELRTEQKPALLSSDSTQSSALSTQSYHREPFAADVSEGKTDPIYKAHSYHTKVPHLAIVPSILHYTEPGDIVLDGFCGSGMTGVAAQWCGSAPEDYRREVEADFQKQGLVKPRWGSRRVVLNDLSPAATFIAANYNLPFDVREFARAGKRILDEVEQEIGWMYRTVHSSTKDPNGHEDEILKALLGETPCPSWLKLGYIEYTVWSEVFTCPDCAGEVVFLDEALDDETKRVRHTFPCPHCGSNLTKDNLQRVFETRQDPANGKPWKRVKYRPSLISYTAGGKRHEKQPDAYDLEILKRIEAMPLPGEIPTNRFPIEQMYHGSRIEPKGFTHIHHFFLPRAAQALGTLWRKANAHPDARIRHMLLFFVEQGILGLTLMNRHHVIGRANVNQPLTGVYYVPSIHEETSYWRVLDGKLNRLVQTFWVMFALTNSATITTGTTTCLSLQNDCIDYIFTDPPFGENIYYADLNFLVESWHRVITNAVPEAIVDKFKKKGLPEYQHLMQCCFEEYYRVLKPGRWMTVVFHNSRNAVWNAIQEAMQAAGFVVADVRTLDKQQGSYRQVTSTAVKQDLVISAYKPNGGLEERFKLEAGTEEGVWDFVRTHLAQLPVAVVRTEGRGLRTESTTSVLSTQSSGLEIVAERQNYLLFDRMVAFHVQRGVTVPLSAAEFYAGLTQRFSERDGMFFLPEQVAEYDKKRMTVREVLQLQLFVTDESSAIQWLKQQITKKPQTFQELQPQFMRETQGGWQKYEKPLELSELLEQNFLRYDGKGDVPNQIHSYLSTNFKELRNLPKDDESLRAKGKDRWYVPDPNKAGDLEKLRERSLLKEFEDYRTSSQKRLKVFRLEAVRAGFKKAWQERDYATIIIVARKVPENVLQEDPKLLMWYDQALTRSGEDS
jgi:16S rRNA G966 N2-methylase RsmD